MNQKFLIGFALLFICISFQAYSQNVKPLFLDENQTIEVRVANALSLLTLEEKVALCHAQSKFSVAGVPRLGIPALWMSDGPHGIRENFQYHIYVNDLIANFKNSLKYA